MPNYTAIDELVKKHNEMKYASSMAKELDMPPLPQETRDVHEVVEQDKTDEQLQSYTSPQTNSIKLPPDLKKLGLKTEEDEQFKAAMNKIKLPISDDKIMEDLQAPPSESKRWYAALLLYILERAHLTLKKVGTKVVRVFKTN